MDVAIAPVVMFVGNYGSGKTEVSVNLAFHRREQGDKVQIADLDVVNPYFRSREVRKLMEAEGIRVIVPDEYLIHADLPIVIPQIRGVIDAPDGIAILDVGGDDVGSTVLGSLHDAIQKSHHDMIQVVNHKRPFTETVVDCLAITREIEGASRLSVTGIVGNSHLMDDTNVKTIVEGATFAENVANELGVPLKFVTCKEELIDDVRAAGVRCPILSMQRRILPPWERKVKMGSKKFLLS